MIDYDDAFEGAEVSCDREDCSRCEQIDGTFQDVIREVKIGGWRITKATGEWQHFCPEHAR